MDLSSGNCVTHSISSIIPSSPINELSTLLLLLAIPSSKAVWNRITLTSMTSKWYFRLSQFELIFVELIVMQIFILRYLEILPLNLNDLFVGDPAGRKRREAPEVIIEKNRLADTMFSILRRLDEEDCFLRTLCELEFESSKGLKLKDTTRSTLQALKMSAKKRNRYEMTPNNVTIEERTLISVFEEAVEIGSVSSKSNGNSTCGIRYTLCSLETNDILFYIDKIENAEFF